METSFIKFVKREGYESVTEEIYFGNKIETKKKKWDVESINRSVNNMGLLFSYCYLLSFMLIFLYFSIYILYFFGDFNIFYKISNYILYISTTTSVIVN